MTVIHDPFWLAVHFTEPARVLYVEPDLDAYREAAWTVTGPYAPADTPLHEMVRLAKEQGKAIDFSIYGPDEGQHPDSDDTKSTYQGGARLTGFKGDPMDVIRAGVRSLRDAAGASPRTDQTKEER